MREQKKSESAITLIALIITIIVLLILAGVAISAVVGDNGILNQATKAADEYSKAGVQEKVETILVDYASKRYTGENPDLANMYRKELQVGVAENEDGTYSFLYNGFQVVTNEKEVISIEEFNLTVDKTYPSVALMKTDTELVEGQLVQTEGYWSETYGGSAYYDIVSTTELEVNEAKCIQLDNGLYAELHAINDTVTVNQFGAYGDGENDDAAAIQNALNSGYGNVTFESERYKFGSTIKMSTSNLNVIGNNATLFWNEDITTPWEQIGITGTSENHVNNINIMYLNFENGDITVIDNPGESIQLRGSYCDNIEISNCKFNIYEIDGNKSRQVTNLWFHTEWKDIVVENCEFTNLTNSNVGGSIWLSDFTSNNNYISQNVIIKNNYIEKSCHDETIAIWRGNINNIKIENNEIITHEENVENPSDMIFTFGNNGTLSNLSFINNKITGESRLNIISMNGNDQSNNIKISNNTIEYTSVSINEYISALFKNVSTKNVQIDSNIIEFNTVNDNILSEFSTGNIVYNNNKIKIKSNTLSQLATDGSFYNNQFNIESNVISSLLENIYEFQNNEISISGNCPIYIIVIQNQLTNNVNIENNTFILNDSNKWSSSDNRTFALLYNILSNNYNINISNNSIIASEQTETQTLINLHSIQDTSPLIINCNNNEYNIFKQIVFYNNQANHKIILNNMEITNSTTLE